MDLDERRWGPYRMPERWPRITPEKLIEIGNSDCTHRDFCGQFIEATFDAVHGGDEEFDADYLSSLVAAAHHIQETTRKVAVIRQLSIRRFRIAGWYELRGHSWAQTLREEGTAMANRRHRGLFREVNNVAGPLRKYVPRFSWVEYVGWLARS